MKSILFISATLMAGACIYGFVDYKSTNRKKEFKSLYRNETAETQSLVAPKPVAEIKTSEKVNEKITVQAEEKKTVGIKKKATKNKKLNLKKYSRAALDIEVPVPEQKQ